MKTRKSKVLLIALVAIVAPLLSACQINFITDINSNGSGTYTQEIGFQGDEASMAGLSAGDDGFCASQNEDLPPSTSIRQETRNDTETWCIYETPFESLEALKIIYGATDTQINDISIVDGQLTYDISLDLSGDGGAPMGAEVYWIITMPGNVTEHNATQQDGNTLTWTLAIGQINYIRAVSETGGFNFDGNIIPYIFGGGAFLCLCCLLPLAIGGVAFYLIRKKKAASEADALADQVA